VTVASAANHDNPAAEEAEQKRREEAERRQQEEAKRAKEATTLAEPDSSSARRQRNCSCSEPPRLEADLPGSAMRTPSLSGRRSGLRRDLEKSAWQTRKKRSD
jgi:hypothetical protein